MRMRTASTIAATLAIVLALGTLAGCTAADESAQQDASRGVSSAEAPIADGSTGELSSQPLPPASPGTDATPAEDRMIIRTQTMRLEVKSTPEAVTSIRGIASEYSAVITDLQVATETDEWLYRYDPSGYATGDGAALRGWVTVRVPADRLQDFVDATMELGTVKFQSEGTEDVTQQHIDLTARLENLRAEEQRLRSFFDAAANVEEMLAVEAELNRVRGEIESFDAQVKYLERQAAMATVTVELTEQRPVVRPEGEDWGFKDAVTDGFRGAARVVAFSVAVLIATAPLWILGLITFFVVRFIVKRRRAARQAEDE